MTLGLCFLCIYWIFGIQSVWILTFLDLEGGGEELELPTGQEALTALRDGEGGGEEVGEVGGWWEEGRKWKLL